ncbi:MaoC family dehydratase [Deinococcus radiophilus]|uniref:MaoC family dehydratase n=1 Tax=Deinococcus radiophilus TaxID=32062 RepID=A0A3S0II47_9DEIO|nr:MaoC family dehydratase [Deinococcus radiophilus]RTR23834.1 MaoC family dehydratase [Deinococcus radiophilus]UFA51447.1 MaoC family dehydratase [Deinococcus radiophilus]
MNADLLRPQGRYFGELPVGAVIRHRVTRTLTESDNILFTTLTMNPQPLHLDFEYAKQSEFGQPLVNSMMTLSLLVGLSVHELTLGTLIANLGFGEVKFPAPVFHGDTIRAESEVLEARASKSRPGQGVVTVRHRAFNQRGEVVAECSRTMLMQGHPTAQTEN